MLQKLGKRSLTTGPGNTPRDLGDEGDAVAAIRPSETREPLEKEEKHQSIGDDGEGNDETATATTTTDEAIETFEEGITCTKQSNSVSKQLQKTLFPPQMGAILLKLTHMALLMKP